MKVIHLFLERDGGEVNKGRISGDEGERTLGGLRKEFHAFT